MSCKYYGCILHNVSILFRGSNCGLDFSLWKEAFSIIAKCKNDTVPSLVMSGSGAYYSLYKPKLYEYANK